MMKVVFRVDASTEIGSGHFMRCITLAYSLSLKAEILFVCRSILPALELLLQEHSFQLFKLKRSESNDHFGSLKYSGWLGSSQENDALETIDAILVHGGCDWLIVDHYGIDHNYESLIRKYVDKILVIDDLADRVHDCDVLVDQNILPDSQVRYLGKVPSHCICLLGSQYFLLRDEFLLQNKNIRHKTGKIKSILIYFGGVDKFNRTQEAVNVVNSLASNLIKTGELQVNVVVGLSHPNLENIQSLCNYFKINFIVQTKEMAKIMAESDLAIGAGGISTFERLYLRLPSILTPISENQIIPLKYMHSIGLINLYENSEQLKILVSKALITNKSPPKKCIDNGIPKIINIMLNQSTTLHQVSAFDIRRTFQWVQDINFRNDFQIRGLTTREIHFTYWRNILSDKTQKVFAIYHAGKNYS